MEHIIPLLWTAFNVIPQRLFHYLVTLVYPITTMTDQPDKPSMVGTFFSRLLHLSPTSSKLDLKCELTVRTIRAIVNKPKQPTITAYQAANGFDRPTKGPIWASRVVLDVRDEVDARVALMQVATTLGNKTGNPIAPPEMSSVRGEWVGHRKGVDRTAVELQIPEDEKYTRLMDDTTSDLTILYVHGGSLFHGSPANSRTTAARLAKLTGGRCFSVGYRLSPKHPFPSALFDVFLAYLALLYPPLGAQYDPVESESIVFAVDSAGGNLCLALIQLILQLHVQGSKTLFLHSLQKEVPVPLPAGVATISAYADLTHALPSWTTNQPYDYLPPENPLLDPNFPICGLWPDEPERASIYCNDTDLAHPLVSPAIAESWAGAPPLLFSYGEEMLVDEGKVIAQRATSQGVRVVFEEYEAMPHIFPTLPVLNKLPQAARCYERWAAFCTACVNSPEEIETGGAFIRTSLGTYEQKIGVEKRSIEGLISLPFEEIQRLMKEREAREMEIFQERRRVKARM
ncbi:hypothetical protein MMC25_006712 [Agyrium rufum]|nr:hypothetical protein [Agyrium rufum]